MMKSARQEKILELILRYEIETQEELVAKLLEAGCKVTQATISRDINVAVENYPDLQAHREIADAMQQNMYLQREITAARELYNDTVNEWNKDVFAWPTKKIVAAKNGYTTRIPFVASQEIKQKAKEVFSNNFTTKKPT